MFVTTVQYKLPESVPTTEGDFIGFTNEGNTGAISFSYRANRRTLFVGQNAEALPQVGDEFTFTQLQAEFSIAVQLSTGQFHNLLQSKSNSSSSSSS